MLLFTLKLSNAINNVKAYGFIFYIIYKNNYLALLIETFK